jgi:hypothetical protein
MGGSYNQLGAPPPLLEKTTASYSEAEGSQQHPPKKEKLNELDSKLPAALQQAKAQISEKPKAPVDPPAAAPAKSPVPASNDQPAPPDYSKVLAAFQEVWPLTMTPRVEGLLKTHEMRMGNTSNTTDLALRFSTLFAAHQSQIGSLHQTMIVMMQQHQSRICHEIMWQGQSQNSSTCCGQEEG